MHRADKNLSTLIVEGNIGAGKTTFLRVVSEHLAVQPVYEPVNQWQEVGGQDLLATFYKDTKRWSYTFQTYAFVSRVVRQAEQAARMHAGVQLIERSVYADRYCFARGLFELGQMTGLEWHLYKEWFAWLVDTYTPRPTGFIYLQTDPAVCYERMKKRQRAAESQVTFDYLQRLHDNHEEWLIAKKDLIPSLMSVPVLVLPVNQDFEHDKGEQERHIASIIEQFPMVSCKEPYGVNVAQLR